MGREVGREVGEPEGDASGDTALSVRRGMLVGWFERQVDLAVTQKVVDVVRQSGQWAESVRSVGGKQAVCSDDGRFKRWHRRRQGR